MKNGYNKCLSRKFRRVNLGQTLLLACITGISCSVERRQATTLIIKASFFAEFSPIFWERTLGTKVIRTFIRPHLSFAVIGLYYEHFSWNSFVTSLNQRSSSEAQFGVSRVGGNVATVFSTRPAPGPHNCYMHFLV